MSKASFLRLGKLKKLINIIFKLANKMKNMKKIKKIVFFCFFFQEGCSCKKIIHTSVTIIYILGFFFDELGWRKEKSGAHGVISSDLRTTCIAHFLYVGEIGKGKRGRARFFGVKELHWRRERARALVLSAASSYKKVLSRHMEYR